MVINSWFRFGTKELGKPLAFFLDISPGSSKALFAICFKKSSCMTSVRTPRIFADCKAYLVSTSCRWPYLKCIAETSSKFLSAQSKEVVESWPPECITKAFIMVLKLVIEKRKTPISYACGVLRLKESSVSYYLAPWLRGVAPWERTRPPRVGRVTVPGGRAGFVVAIWNLFLWIKTLYKYT